MSKFDDMIDWASGYTRAVNDRKALELKEREVAAAEHLAATEEHDWIIAAQSKTEVVAEMTEYDAIVYIRQQLIDGCAYVIVPNDIAKVLVRAASERSAIETIREKRKQ